MLADCATIANMAPEYGATCGIFRVNAVALDYLRFKHHRVAVLGADLLGDLAVQDRSTTPRPARSPR